MNHSFPDDLRDLEQRLQSRPRPTPPAALRNKVLAEIAPVQPEVAQHSAWPTALAAVAASLCLVATWWTLPRAMPIRNAAREASRAAAAEQLESLGFSPQQSARAVLIYQARGRLPLMGRPLPPRPPSTTNLSEEEV